MGIRFLCYYCEKRLNVKSAQAGEEGECPHCGKTVSVPEKSTIPSKKAKANQPRRRPSHTESDDSHIDLVNVEQREIAAVSSDQQSFSDHSQSASAVVQKKKKQKTTRKRKVTAEIAKRGEPADNLFMLDKPALPASMGKVDPLEDSPTKVWYFRNRDLGEKGPLKSKEMQEFLDNGSISLGSIVWREDWEDWIPAEKVFPNLAELAKAVKQKNMVDRSFKDANYQIPDEFNPHSKLNRRRRRKNQIFMGAIATGILIIGALIFVLFNLLTK